MPPSALIGPNTVTILGLILSLVGSGLLAVDALAPSDFLNRLESTDKPVRVRMATVGFLAVVNRVFVVLALATIGIAILWPLVGLGKALVLGPLTYPTWKLVARVADGLDRAVDRIGPASRRRPGDAYPGCAVWLLTWLPWGLLKAVVGLGAILVRYGLNLPLSWFSERLVAPAVIRGLRPLAKVQRREESLGFRGLAFKGLVLLLVGFFYQILGLFWGILA